VALGTLVALETLVRRLLIRELQLSVASCREFEVASGSEFDVPTVSCNNQASPSIDDIVQTEFDQEKEQELIKDINKFIQDQGSNESPPLSHVFGSNQNSKILNSHRTTENSSLATVSEFGWLELAEETPTSPGRAQPGFLDTGEQLAQLVAAQDPSVALVSDLGWNDVYNNKKQPTNAVNNTWTPPVKDTGEQLAELVAAEDPSVALVSDLGWRDVYNNKKQPTNAVDTLLPMAVEEARSSLESNSSSLGTNNILTATNNSGSCQGLQVTSSPPGGPTTEAARARPSVIVSTGSSSKKRAFKETECNAEKELILEKASPFPILIPDPIIMDDDHDEVPPAVLEKRKKGNARCKKYRVNKKKKETIKETELEMLTKRNEFLRQEEKRLTDRKRKLQQSYLSLIRQKKIRFE